MEGVTLFLMFSFYIHNKDSLTTFESFFMWTEAFIEVKVKDFNILVSKLYDELNETTC